MTAMLFRRVRGLPQPGRTVVMGVVNVTPDSFSDGGEWFDHDAAVRHGHQLVEEGADIIDVGGESTRPGAARPSALEESRRVLPVIESLAPTGVAISIDTMRAETAERAVQAGAACVNDVSGGRADEAMIATVARLGVPYVCMHWRGHSADMQSRAEYGDVVAEVSTELQTQVYRCLDAGIAADQLVVDPGIGFAKNAGHNWELLQRLDELDVMELPILMGVSRKAFLGRLLGSDDLPRPARERDDASLALTTWLAVRRLWGVRVHTVRPHRDAIAVVQRLAIGTDHASGPTTP